MIRSIAARALMLLIPVALLTGGCGLKGDLYLEEDVPSDIKPQVDKPEDDVLKEDVLKEDVPPEDMPLEDMPKEDM